MKLSQKTIEGLSPGIRALVVWLNKHDFETVDSGDGSNHEAGMEGAMAEPAVTIRVTQSSYLIHEAHRLRSLMRKRGINFDGPHRIDLTDGSDTITWPYIIANYDPQNRIPLIILGNVLSVDAGLIDG